MATAAEIRQAKKYHSLTFYTPSASAVLSQGYQNAGLGSSPKNTWYDWHLVPTARPVINPPTIRTQYIEVPGYNGYLDFSDALSSNKKGPREGSISFFVMNDYGNWYDRFETIMNYVHGKQLNVVLNDDETKFYHGRWQVSEWINSTDGTCSGITFSYYLQPDWGSVS